MRILFLGKTDSRREINWMKGLKKIESNLKFEIIEFNQRNYIELLENMKNINFKIKSYSFVNYLKTEYPKICTKEKDEILKFLEESEKKYDISYKFIQRCDRTLIRYNCEKQYIILYLMTKYAEKLLKTKKYFKIVGELSNSSDIIFYKVAEFYKIKYINICHGRFPNTIVVEDLEGNRKGVEEKYKELKNRKFTRYEKKILDTYLKKIELEDIKPNYEEKLKKVRIFNLKKEFLHLKKVYKNILLSYLIDKKYSCIGVTSIYEKLKNKVFLFKYPIKIKMDNKLWDEVNEEEKFLFVPLHYQPEASTLTFAQEFLNQYEHIKKISENIPINYKLYVKEHPAMYIKQSRNYYLKLKKIKNLKLISPFEDSIKIIKKSKGIITLTNTTGYEGILYKKPVYIFGKVFYQDYDYVNKIKNYSELFKKIIENEKNYLIDEHNYYSFILAILLNLYEGDYTPPYIDISSLSEKNAINIAKVILKE